MHGFEHVVSQSAATIDKLGCAVLHIGMPAAYGGVGIGQEIIPTYLLVVPVTFLPVLRAEHTTTTRVFAT